MESTWSEIVEESFKNASSLRYLTYQYTGGFTDGFALTFTTPEEGLEGYTALANYPFSALRKLPVDAKNITLEIYYGTDRAQLLFTGADGEQAMVFNLNYDMKELETFETNNYANKYIAFSIAHIVEDRVKLFIELKDLYLNRCKLFRKWNPLNTLAEYKKAVIRSVRISNNKAGHYEGSELIALLGFIKDFEDKYENTFK